MPPRKAKKTPSVQADNAPSDVTTPSTISKKRKVDWTTIDEPELFEGFALKSVTSNKRSKSGNAQKKDDPTVTADADALALGYRDASLSADIVQTNPFSEVALSSAHYTVEPAHIWESTKRYRKFTISEAEFEVGQCVFIEKTPETQDAESAIQHWVGRVLEVRAGDASHVYLRVYWFYRPEDLPEGRQPHHGESELIASNHMDIIEALSVSDKADVVYWDEDPEKPWPLKHQLFWRQTFDLWTTKSKQLSPIRKICVDKTPANPDEPLVQCPSCLVWLHAQCLEDSAVRDVASKDAPQAKKVATPGKKKRGRPSSSSSSLEPPPFTAYLSTLGASGTTYLTITNLLHPDEKERRYNVDIKCLKCDALIEAAPEEIPPEPPLTTKAVALIEKAIPDLFVGTMSPSKLEPNDSPKPSVRKRGRPRKNPLPAQDVANQSADDEKEQNKPVPPVVADGSVRKRGRPRKNPLPAPEVAVEQEPEEDQQDVDTPVPVMIADDGKEQVKPEPYTPVPVAAPVSQSMFGSMRKMLFRGGV